MSNVFSCLSLEIGSFWFFLFISQIEVKINTKFRTIFANARAKNLAVKNRRSIILFVSGWGREMDLNNLPIWNTPININEQFRLISGKIWNFLTLTCLMGLPPHTPVARKLRICAYSLLIRENRYLFTLNGVIKGWLLWINIVLILFNLIRSNKL